MKDACTRVSAAWRGSAIACLVAALVPLSAQPVRAEEAIIAVATNFKEVVGELETMFEAETEHAVTVTAGSTGKLYAQIKSAAPFDAFFAADQKRPALLEAEGDIVPNSRFTYAVGRVALWSPDPDLIAGNGLEVIKAGKFDHLAIANPELAPYGFAAKQALQHCGLWDAVSAKIVMGQNIGQTFSMIATGNASLGFVAKSYVLSRRNKQPGSAWDVPAEAHDPIRQDAVLLKKGANNAAAKAFLNYVRSDKAAAVIERFGYSVE